MSPRIPPAGTGHVGKPAAARVAPGAGRDADLAPDDAAAGRPPSTPRGRPGEVETAPKVLLQAPESVFRAADDFFESLARHVEGDH